MEQDEVILDLGIMDLGSMDASETRSADRVPLWHRLRAPRVSVVAMVLVVTAGVALAAVATYGWQAHRQRSADESVFALAILADPSLADSEFPFRVSDQGRLDTLVRLNIINAGPTVVGVSQLHAEQDGVTLRGLAGEEQIGPGVTKQVTVTASVDGATAAVRPPVSVEVTVRTADGKRHQAQYFVSFTHTPIDLTDGSVRIMVMPDQG